jgi:opacity protein-like surface antigen
MLKSMKRYKMIKSIYFIISFLILEVNLNKPVIAGGSETLEHSFFRQGRARFGLALEYLNLEAKLKDNFSALGIIFHSDRTQTKKNIQIAPSIELGTTILNDFYLGVLSSWHYVDAKTKSRAPLKALTYFHHEFKINHYVDILAKPGYKLTPNTMIYGLIGPSIVKWSHTTDQFEQSNINSLVTKRDRFKISKTSVGVGLGLGLEYYFKEKYAFSIDYTHHFHRSASKTKNMAMVENLGGGPIRRSGNVSKSVMPSYSTIALRFTISLRLW